MYKGWFYLNLRYIESFKMYYFYHMHENSNFLSFNARQGMLVILTLVHIHLLFYQNRILVYTCCLSWVPNKEGVQEIEISTEIDNFTD